MAVLPTGFLRSNLWASPSALSQALVEGVFRDRTGLGLELFRAGLEASGVRDEGLSGLIDNYQNASSLSRIAGWIERHPVESEQALLRIPRGIFFPKADASETGMIRIGGAYRSMEFTGEIGPEIAAFGDKSRDLEDRLKALNAAGQILTGLDADSDDFFRGVAGLFELASRPSGPREIRDRLRLESILLLKSVLRRMPEDPRRQEAFVHAYLKFKEAAHGDLFRPSSGRALAASTQQIGYRLARCKKYCSKAVQRCLEEAGRELVQSGDPPWTLRKAKSNAKVGLGVGGELFLSGALWAALGLLISTPFALSVLTVAALCLPGATLIGFLWRSPRRLRQKAVALTLPSVRSHVRRLESGF